MLEECPEICCLGSATNGRDGIRHCREKQPAIVLLDLGLPDMGGFEVLDCLHALSCPPRVLLLTARMDEALLHRVGSSGVAGLIWKNADFARHLRPALAAVAAGRPYLPPEVREALHRFRRSPAAFFKVLSTRELELVSLLGQGLEDGDVAARTGCCRGTIRNHWHNIARKLGLGNRHALQRWAEARGFGSRFPPTSAPRSFS